MKEGFQIGLSGADENCDYITFDGRKANWNLRANKTQDEMACAERFCRAKHPELVKLTKMPQNSPVDIHAESADKTRSRDFQVTSVWPDDFWKPFGAEGRIEQRISREELRNLIRESIRKKLEMQSSSQDVTLLIDTKPADLPPQCLERIRSDKQFQQEMAALSNFCQIWVVDSNGAIQLK